MSDELLKQIVDKLSDIDKRLDGVDKRFDGTDKRLDGIDKRFDGINGRLNGLEKELSEFRIETKEHFDQHDKKLDVITKQVVKNSEDITQIKADQSALLVGQARQDKIFETLAMRSLEQETDIRDLKRADLKQ
ncbi:hypothetical protein [Sporolactobacillus vineae]|uniref:hypothetical protein n=1 Tax=Sporolactobacillus vineae TaxID=444463 RepID=UPI000289C26C|nr:hypothetical protein [Sporolactobacillus vineae]